MYLCWAFAFRITNISFWTMSPETPLISIHFPCLSAVQKGETKRAIFTVCEYRLRTVELKQGIWSESCKLMELATEKTPLYLHVSECNLSDGEIALQCYRSHEPLATESAVGSQV